MREEKFSVEITTYIKGIAIVLMICNHLYLIPDFIFPENQYISIAIGSKTLAAYIGGFGKICVGIYTLLTGIGLYHTYQIRQNAYRHTLKKLIDFLETYWLTLFLVFIPVMYFTGVLEIDFSILLKNMIGYQTNYCRVAWYVLFYIELIISFPLYVWVFKKLESISNGRMWMEMLLFAGEICFILIMRSIFGNGDFWMVNVLTQYLGYLPIALFGYFCARHSLFENTYKFIILKVKKHILPPFAILVICCVFVLRGLIKDIYGFNMDLIYAWFVIQALWLVKPFLGDSIVQVILYLGNYSTELWFLHAIFFVGSMEVQRLAYWPKYDILVLAWTIILLLPVAFILRKIKFKINICKNTH